MVHVEIRPAASLQVKTLIRGQNPEVGVRVYAQLGGGGCGGGSAVQFGLAFAKPRADDEVIRRRWVPSPGRSYEHQVRGRGHHRLRRGAAGIRLQDHEPEPPRTRRSGEGRGLWFLRKQLRERRRLRLRALRDFPIRFPLSAPLIPRVPGAKALPARPS